MKYALRCLLAVFMSFSCLNLCAQNYPNKPVRIIVPFPAGGSVDTLARFFGQKLSEAWRQPAIVENRAGAGGNIGVEVVAKSSPDGHTILMTIQGLAISATLYRRLPFDPIKDLIPVVQLTSSNQALVVPTQFPAKTVKELIAMARAQPGKLNYASSGPGAPNHLFGEILKSLAGIDVAHIPYKGDAPQAAALLAGEVEMSFMPLSAIVPLVRANKVRALGVITAKRAELMPDIPTLVESGLSEFDFGGWIGLFVAGGTPGDVVARINSESARIINLAELRDRLRDAGNDPVGSTQEQFNARYLSDITRFGRVIRSANIPLVD
ncbi:MAG: Bug family tripartite tricarboxylate transporter substrate binding protein [Burkholderiales bacterium]